MSASHLQNARREMFLASLREPLRKHRASQVLLIDHKMLLVTQLFCQQLIQIRSTNKDKFQKGTAKFQDSLLTTRLRIRKTENVRDLNLLVSPPQSEPTEGTSAIQIGQFLPAAAQNLARIPYVTCQYLQLHSNFTSRWWTPPKWEIASLLLSQNNRQRR